MENEVIFDDDEFFDDPIEEPVQEPPTNEADDLTSEVLRIKGISDPSKIKFEDETGAVIERSWDTLTREEQLNILAGEDPTDDVDLDDAEIELLNAIRSSGMSVDDYLNQFKQVQEVTPSYKIDELSDEDVYALDLLEKIGAENITDEELTEAVNKAKENEALFAKTVEGLRKEYIRLQQDEEAQLANEQAAQQQQAYQQFATSIQEQIYGLDSFAGQQLELSQQDAEELAAFMLDIDDSGMSPFGRALQDPQLFTKAAFWLLNEDQIVEELTKQMQDNYKRGYEAAKKDLNKSTVVFQPKQQPAQQDYDELFFDDEF